MGIRKISDRITPSVRKNQSELKTLPRLAYNFFKSVTPVDSGNARNRTRLQGNTIKADYKYARALDDGHSKQAPKGMTEPTLEYIQRQSKIRIKK